MWGPSPVISIQGFRYYVIFIDNWSRYCLFYPLKKMPDFYSTFVVFQKLVENQFNTRIENFQCDRGGEFVSNKFLSLLQQSGIKQYISFPHTLQKMVLRNASTYTLPN